MLTLEHWDIHGNSKSQGSAKATSHLYLRFIQEGYTELLQKGTSLPWDDITTQQPPLQKARRDMEGST